MLDAITCNRVRAWLKSRWQVSVPNDWLVACIEWIQSEHEGLPLEYPDLNQMVYEQWLVSDLRELGMASLPEALAEQDKVILNGKYCLQVNSIVDASAPLYGQLNKLRGTENENVNVTASTQLTQPAWETKPTRVLMLRMTDGVQEVQGMEYKSIPSLSIKISTGTKVLVHGETICRRGVFMLKPENLTLLGGEVEALFEKYTLEKNLQKALDHNRAMDQPETARKEFQKQSKPVPWNSVGHNQEGRPTSFNQSDPTQRPQPNDVTNKPQSGQMASVPITDEWGDEDLDLSGLDDAQLTGQQEWRCDDSTDLEALMDDDLDEQILASQGIPTMEKDRTTQYNQPMEYIDRLLTQTSQHTARNNQQTAQHGQQTTFTNQKTTHFNEQATLTNQQVTQLKHVLHTTSHSQNSKQNSDTTKKSTHTDILSAAQKPFNKVKPWRVKEETFSRPSCSVTDLGDAQTASTWNLAEPAVKSLRMEVQSLELNSKPFTYLHKLQESWPPTRVEEVTVKAYVATLLDKLEHKGRQWSLTVKINDGTAVMDVILSDEILTTLIGFSASECLKLREIARQDNAARLKLTTGIKSCQEKLINMSAILDISLDPKQAAPVVLRYRHNEIDDLTALCERNSLR